MPPTVGSAPNLGQPAGDVAPSLAEVAAVFATLETASGPAAKRALFEALLTRCDPG